MGRLIDILADSWARPAILTVKVILREGMFLFLQFLHFHSFSFLSCPSLSSPLLSLFSLSLGDYTKWPTRVDMLLNPNSINQSINQSISQMHSLQFTVCALLSTFFVKKSKQFQWISTTYAFIRKTCLGNSNESPQHMLLKIKSEKKYPIHINK